MKYILLLQRLSLYKKAALHFVILFAGMVLTTYSVKCQVKIDPAAVALNNRAAKLIAFNQNSKLDSANLLLDKAIKIQPDYFIAYANKVKVCSKQKNFKAASEAAKHLEIIEPDNSEAVFELGYLLEKSGSVSEARKKYIKAVSLNKEKIDKLVSTDKLYTSTTLNYALNLIFLDRYEESKKHINIVLAKEPNNTYAKLLLNKSHQQMLNELTK